MINLPSPPITDWSQLARVSWDYYRGYTSIYGKTRVSLTGGKVTPLPRQLPNALLSSDLIHTIVSQRVRYVLARQLRITQLPDPSARHPGPSADPDIEDELFGAVSAWMLDFWRPTRLRGMLRDAIIGGYVWIYPYIDASGKPQISHIPAWECEEIRDIDGNIQAIIQKNGKKRKIYTSQGVLIQRLRTLDTPIPAPGTAVGTPRQVVGVWDTGINYLHTAIDTSFSSLPVPAAGTWNERSADTRTSAVPLYRLAANDLAAPILRGLLQLVDIYDGICSNWVDAVLQYPDGGIMIVKNLVGEADNLAELLAQTRVIQVRNTSEDPGGGVEYLDIPDHPDSVIKILNHLRGLIYEIGGGFDEHGDFAKCNIRAEVIRAMQAALRASTDYLADSLVDVIQSITPLLCPAARAVIWRAELEDRDYRSLEEVTNMMIAMGMRISNETLLRNYPMVDDVAAEMRRLADEPASAPRTVATGSPNGGGKIQDLTAAIQRDATEAVPRD